MASIRETRIVVVQLSGNDYKYLETLPAHEQEFIRDTNSELGVVLRQVLKEQRLDLVYIIPHGYSGHMCVVANIV